MTDQPSPPADPPPEPPHPPAAPGGTGAWLFGALIGLVVVGVVVAAWFAGKDEGRREASGTTVTRAGATRRTATTPAAAAGPGRQLFVARCAGCHTLRQAGTSGTVGPNLDELKPGAAQVQNAIAAGGAGSGTMPKGLYSGRQAQQVAAYVAAAAGAP